MTDRLPVVVMNNDIISDPDIIGGVPIFKGTRIPVHLIADIVSAGTPLNEILDGYPTLNEQMIQMAVNYALANPTPEPVKQFWRDSLPIQVVRMRIPNPNSVTQIITDQTTTEDIISFMKDTASAISLTPAQERFADRIYNISTGQVELVDITDISDEEAIEIMLKHY